MTREEMRVRFVCAALTGIFADLDNYTTYSEAVSKAFYIADLALAEKDRRDAEPIPAPIRP